MGASLREWKPWAAARHWAPALVAAGGVLGAVLVVATALHRGRAEPRPPNAPIALAGPVALSSSAVPDCVRGEELVHDVRWAAMCMRLEELGQGDGYAECQLPDELAARLYALLQQGERRCMAELKAPPPR